VRRHRLDRRDGVIVSFVERGSEGAESGLAQGDVIEQVENRSVEDIEDFRDAMSELDGSRPFLIRARRGTDTRFMLIVPRGERTVDASGRGSTGD
jgi:S1-C subfamily serine protease